jgi:ubiquitin carboxyl-terminal hydrolase 4/11
VHPLPRKVIARGIAQEPALELHPPMFKALLLSDDSNADTITGPPPPVISLSSKDSVKTLFRHLANAFPSNVGPYRIWRIEVEDVDGSIYPPSKITTNNGMLVLETDTSIEDSTMQSGDTFVVEFKKGSEWTITNSQRDATSIIKADGLPPLLGSKNDHFSQKSSSSKSANAIINSVMSKAVSTSFMGSSGFGASNSRSKPQQPGTLGLGNM